MNDLFVPASAFHVKNVNWCYRWLQSGDHVRPGDINIPLRKTCVEEICIPVGNNMGVYARKCQLGLAIFDGGFERVVWFESHAERNGFRAGFK